MVTMTNRYATRFLQQQRDHACAHKETSVPKLKMQEKNGPKIDEGDMQRKAYVKTAALKYPSNPGLCHGIGARDRNGSV
ncbi:UNVERIFIED_CONTAM: hypothetical protein FKN15_056601 [Acipenser sinensis]